MESIVTDLNGAMKSWGNLGEILGIDGGIYWPPCAATHILKCDPYSDLSFLVGDDFLGDNDCRQGYQVPDGASKVLAIDPLKEYAMSFWQFLQSSDDNAGKTNFD